METATPYYQVSLEREDISQWVNSVTLTESDCEADNFAIAIADPKMIYSDCLFEGSEVEIIMGYTESDQQALMLRAVITKIEVRLPENGIPTLALKGEDKSILMGIAEKNKVWRDTTINEIVRTIGNSDPYQFAGVEARLDPDPRVSNRTIHQDGKTDLAFLQDLAREYHAKCFVELNEEGDEVLYFLPERQIVTLRRPETIDLSYRRGPQSNLMSFSPAFDSSYIDRLKQIADVDTDGNEMANEDRTDTEVFVWDLDEERVALANAVDAERIRNLYQAGATRKETLQRRLSERQPAIGTVAADRDHMEQTNDTLLARRLGMTASGKTVGNIWLRAKSNVDISGVSSRFNGEWYVSQSTHKIDRSNYTTEFKCVR